MKRGGGLHSARPDCWPPTKWPRAAPGGLIAASVTYLSLQEGVPPCLCRCPPLGGTLGVHQTSWRIPFPRHACMLLVLGSASTPKAAQALGCSLTRGLGSGFGPVTCMARAMCRRYGHWASYCCVALVFGFGFRVNPATPGLGLGCVCLGTGFVLSRHSWLRFVVCAVGLGFWPAPRQSWRGFEARVGLCALSLYPVFPASGLLPGCVCLGRAFGCAPPLMAGVLGSVCVCVRALLVPRESWPGCAVWVCVLGRGLGLRPANPGSGVGVCVCWCARSACTPRILLGVRGMGVFAGARVSAALCHPWLGRWGVCVFVCALRLYFATPGWAVRRALLCLGSDSGCAMPLLAGMLECVCVCVRAPRVPR